MFNFSVLIISSLILNLDYFLFESVWTNISWYPSLSDSYLPFSLFYLIVALCKPPHLARSRGVSRNKQTSNRSEYTDICLKHCVWNQSNSSLILCKLNFISSILLPAGGSSAVHLLLMCVQTSLNRKGFCINLMLIVWLVDIKCLRDTFTFINTSYLPLVQSYNGLNLKALQV